MRTARLLAAALVLGGSAFNARRLVAQSAAPATVVTAQRLRALGDSLTPGASKTAQLGGGRGFTYAVTHRDSTGGPESHASWTDMFVVEAGKATILTGGRLEGSHEVSPGESRGGAIRGGTRKDVRPGDVVIIPAGTPHQMLVAPGATISYLAFKIAKPTGAR